MIAILRRGSLLLALVALASAGSRGGEADAPRVIPNDNRQSAGKLDRGVLTVHLEAREGRWFPDGDAGPSIVLQHFAEAGRAPQNPGPMIRVSSGIRVHVTVHSALRDSVLVVYGLHTRPGSESDTIQVAPGATRDVSFIAGAPGTYFYWGTTTHKSVADRNGIDSQLQGAFIVDAPSGRRARDRVFMLGSWSGPVDSATGYTAELRVINGRSWPGTERLTQTVGDTVLWRWINPTDSPHPMHLHGFYFDVMSRGTWAADTTFALEDMPRVVTEMPISGHTFTMRWIPDEPGNWLLHCHVAFHTSMFLAATVVPDPPDPMAIDHVHAMRGMVLALTVRSRGDSARRPEAMPNARRIRLIAQSAPKRYKGKLDEMAFVLQEGDNAPAADSVPIPSSLLVLRRNEPVRVTIVNHTRTETGVHWHGLEVPSFSDGVPGWSGVGSRLAPAIAPGDSFVASFTPTRSGTFIYHAHSNEDYQINLGLYGALLVVDSVYHPEHERLIIIGSGGYDEKSARINGKLVPDTLRLSSGATYRIRLIDILPDWTLHVSLVRGDSAIEWRALARDGAELAPRAQVMRRADMIAGPGQTMDFEYRAEKPGLLRLVVEQRERIWKTQLPVMVSP
jgi:manganese oxidase